MKKRTAITCLFLDIGGVLRGDIPSKETCLRRGKVIAGIRADLGATDVSNTLSAGRRQRTKTRSKNEIKLC